MFFTWQCLILITMRTLIYLARTGIKLSVFSTLFWKTPPKSVKVSSILQEHKNWLSHFGKIKFSPIITYSLLLYSPVKSRCNWGFTFPRFVKGILKVVSLLSDFFHQSNVNRIYQSNAQKWREREREINFTIRIAYYSINSTFARLAKFNKRLLWIPLGYVVKTSQRKKKFAQESRLNW